MLDESSKLVKLVQLTNAFSPILSTLDGIFTLTKNEQLENTPKPKLVMLEGSSIVVRPEFLNASVPILSTLDGIVMLVSPLQFSNALFEMRTTLYVFPSITTFEGIVTEPSTQFSFVTSAVESVKTLNLSGDSDSSIIFHVTDLQSSKAPLSTVTSSYALRITTSRFSQPANAL